MSKEGLHRFYGGNTEALRRVHNAYMDGISPEAQAFIDKNDLHHLAHHPEFENIRAMAESEHLQEVKRLHEQESPGPKNENSANDRALGPRAKRMAGHTRHRLVRD